MEYNPSSPGTDLPAKEWPREKADLTSDGIWANKISKPSLMEQI
jgi:hypothetical protein